MGAYDKQIWLYLLEKIGNKFGVAGLMGNLYAESGLNPKNVQNGMGFTDDGYTSSVDNGSYTKSQFVNDSVGYGLAQWTYYSRKQALYERWKSGGYNSISNINLQLEYLWYELQNLYPGVLTTLKNATSVREASDDVLHRFEKPEVQTEAVEIKRAEYGQNYYNTYSGTSVTTYTPRLTHNNPSAIWGNFHYYSQNPFYLSGWGMPNCTTYAWGRFWEIADPDNKGDNKPKLSTGNAEMFYPHTSDGYERGTTPKLGAVICWARGSTDPDIEDGGGHVAIVEKINSDGGIVCSASGWIPGTSPANYWSNGFFWLQNHKPDDNYFYKDGYTFQGFIYNPYVTSSSGGDSGGDSGGTTGNWRPSKKRKGYNWVLFNQNRLRRLR